MRNARHPPSPFGVNDFRSPASRVSPSCSSSLQEVPTQLQDLLDESSRDPLNVARFKDPLHAYPNHPEQGS